jgi:hypothetical protein
MKADRSAGRLRVIAALPNRAHPTGVHSSAYQGGRI